MIVYESVQVYIWRLSTWSQAEADGQNKRLQMEAYLFTIQCICLCNCVCFLKHQTEFAKVSKIVDGR